MTNVYVEPPDHSAPGPCDDCAQCQRCARDHLACQAFTLWIVRARKWRTAPREPSRARYALIFGAPPLKRAA